MAVVLSLRTRSELHRISCTEGAAQKELAVDVTNDPKYTQCLFGP